MALSSGKKFTAGANELVKVSFRAAPSATGSLVVAFADDPVLSETSDDAAGELPSDYVSGTIMIDPLPSLRITQDGQKVTLAWALSATNYVLQEADSASATVWTDATATPSITDTEKVVSLLTNGAGKYYRLHRP